MSNAEIRNSYVSWQSVKQRINNPQHPSYPQYGGRGIKYPAKWETFAGFYEDMGNRPDGLSIERIDNEADYSKENCKWATPIEQANNRRNSIRITFDGRTQTLKQWTRELGLEYRIVYRRYRACPEFEPFALFFPQAAAELAGVI